MILNIGLMVAVFIIARLMAMVTDGVAARVVGIVSIIIIAILTVDLISISIQAPLEACG